uniref:Uncharacterized protein n=1 Tax=Anguilla anguilla TaxID=7936 RepID=A0A0E9QEB1_ANGAN
MDIVMFYMYAISCCVFHLFCSF